jgi:hypothetical protein
MAAFWQQSELVFRLKFTKTDSAVKWVLQSYNGFVIENREGVYEGLVHPSIMEVEELLQLSLKNSHTLQIIWVSVLGSHKKSNKQVKQTRNKENDGKNYNDEQYAWTHLVVQIEEI